MAAELRGTERITSPGLNFNNFFRFFWVFKQQTGLNRMECSWRQRTRTRSDRVATRGTCSLLILQFFIFLSPLLASLLSFWWHYWWWWWRCGSHSSLQQLRPSSPTTSSCYWFAFFPLAAPHRQDHHLIRFLNGFTKSRHTPTISSFNCMMHETSYGVLCSGASVCAGSALTSDQSIALWIGHVSLWF